jgi:hypothetical protein
MVALLSTVRHVHDISYHIKRMCRTKTGCTKATIANTTNIQVNNYYYRSSSSNMAANNQNNQLFEIDHFIRHRVNRRNKTVQILVKWTDFDQPTWEPEAVLQETAGRTLYNYWHERRGRDRATRLREYHVFKILARGWRGGAWYFECQWVGYSRVDKTWEPEAKVRSNAGGLVRKWFADQAAANQNAPAANP